MKNKSEINCTELHHLCFWLHTYFAQYDTIWFPIIKSPFFPLLYKDNRCFSPLFWQWHIQVSLRLTCYTNAHGLWRLEKKREPQLEICLTFDPWDARWFDHRQTRLAHTWAQAHSLEWPSSLKLILSNEHWLYERPFLEGKQRWFSLSPIKPISLVMINTLRLIRANLPHSCMLVYRLRNKMTLKHKCLCEENQASTGFEDCCSTEGRTWVQSDLFYTPAI